MRKDIIKKIVAFVAAALLFAAMMPTGEAYAERGPAAFKLNVVVDSVEQTYDQYDMPLEIGGGKITWDDATKTITLDNVNLEGQTKEFERDHTYPVFLVEDDITFELKGNNTIINHSGGIFGENNKITICGSGALSIESDTAFYYGCIYGKEVSIKDTTVKIHEANLQNANRVYITAITGKSLLSIQNADVTVKDDNTTSVGFGLACDFDGTIFIENSKINIAIDNGRSCIDVGADKLYFGAGNDVTLSITNKEVANIGVIGFYRKMGIVDGYVLYAGESSENNEAVSPETWEGDYLMYSSVDAIKNSYYIAIKEGTVPNKPEKPAPAPNGCYLDPLRECLRNLIANNASGDTVIWQAGDSLPYDVMQLIKQSDVTVEFKYTYENVSYDVFINKDNVPEEYVVWYGPLYLAGLPQNDSSKKESIHGEYVVIKDDTLNMLSERFGTTVDELMRLNPFIKDSHWIFPGQVIKY